MTAKPTPTEPMNEEQMVHLVRNALLVAGQEMGNGDQWPVVKDTIYKIMKDWEDLKVERAVDVELKAHLYAQLDGMEASLPECSPEAAAQLIPKIKHLREVCDAYFSELNRNAVYADEDDQPEHVKRMRAIIQTLEESK
ncbi:MAG: hypothetical protein P4M15_12640 [Alphaproteobacteria bacterium]|nr:hypothetical protein [Alphaproteobacteria bacterium]